jgi:hypothetical protein
MRLAEHIQGTKECYITLLGLRGGGPSLSVEIPMAAKIWAISFVLMPQLLATFFWHRLCTFILQTVTK